MEIKVPDALAGGLLGTLALNFAIADWRLNPLWDLTYARVEGPILFGNHAIVGLLVVGCAFYLSYPEGKILFSAVAILAVVGLHELIVQLLSIPLYGWALVQPQMFTNWQYVLWGCMAAFIGFSNIKQKKAFFITACVIFFYFCIVFSIYALQDFRPITLMKFAPGPQYWSLEANIVEVIGWVAALLTQASLMSRYEKEGLVDENAFNPSSFIVRLERNHGVGHTEGNQENRGGLMD